MNKMPTKNQAYLIVALAFIASCLIAYVVFKETGLMTGTIIGFISFWIILIVKVIGLMIDATSDNVESIREIKKWIERNE